LVELERGIDGAVEEVDYYDPSVENEVPFTHACCRMLSCLEFSVLSVVCAAGRLRGGRKEEQAAGPAAPVEEEAVPV
jgi:hypothetical protein